jgi:hypothetical protein
VLPLKSRRDSSQEIALTDEHISILERRTAKFRGASPKDREKMVSAAADRIKETWREDVEFDRDAVISVCALSANWAFLIYIFLAYSQISVWQNKTAVKVICV